MFQVIFLAAVGLSQSDLPAPISSWTNFAQPDQPKVPELVPPPVPDVTQPPAECKENGNGEKKDEDDGCKRGFCGSLCHTYFKAFSESGPIVGGWCKFIQEWEEEQAKINRRSMPDFAPSPPFPVHEYQGYPLIGSPPGEEIGPIQKALEDSACGDFFKNTKIKFEGWVTASGNWSTASQSNSPDSYWLVPNRFEMDQLVFRWHRELDSVQTDHVDWGGRWTLLYGIDYRYMTAGGWFSDQLLEHNRLYGFDPTEQYVDVYVPQKVSPILNLFGLADGYIFRIGRWIACPDIETQFAPDNYMASHSILFTFDTYTQTGFMNTWFLSKQWMFQVGLNFGDDQAPWYHQAYRDPSLFVGLRWVAKSNNDALYTCLNQCNDARFHHFTEDGQPAGHDNYNYIVSTWEHRFTERFHTKTEGYYMWQLDAELGGTPTIGPPQYFAPFVGDNTTLPGLSKTFGVLNYTAYALSKATFITLRNEWWDDERGMRSGFPGVYSSHAIGMTWNVNALWQIRPEIGYYRNWTNDAFDNGTKHGITIYGFDTTLHF
jgi:hypothetical protein